MDIDWDKFNKDCDAFISNAFEKAFNKPLGQRPPLFSAQEIYDFFSRPFESNNKPDTKNEKSDASLTELFYWLPVLKHPLVIIILGGRGWGKSALGYKIPEYLRYKADIFVVGLPKRARKLLPNWIGSVPTLEDVPPNSIAIIDESYNLFHSRTSSSERSRILSNMMNLSRQRGQTLIFITQEARQIDKNISSSANVIIFKNPGIMQFEFERKELRKLAEEAKRMFAAIADKDKPRWSYVYAPESNFVGMIENSLPSFWTSGLSKAYADTKFVNEIRFPSKMPREEKIRKAKELHESGWSNSQIGRYFGVAKSTVHNWIHDYPYRRELN